MNTPALLAAGCTLHEHEPLSRHTTFQLGGPCPLLIGCATPEQVLTACAELRRTGREFVLIGGGSNLLVADAGLPFVVVRYRADRPQLERADDRLTISGSTLLDAVVSYAAAAGLAGLEHLSGIPGTLGGALCGNAGAFGHQIGDLVEEATLLDRDGRVHHVSHHDLHFAYRSSDLQESGNIVLAARLRLPTGDAATLTQHRAECLAIRQQKHPDWKTMPTAGSFFRNVAPTSAAGRRQAAGWFLEEAGALAMRVNGACPSPKHANIIIRDGPCSAQDVLDLSRQMAAAVAAKFQLHLEREVILLGPFA